MVWNVGLGIAVAFKPGRVKKFRISSIEHRRAKSNIVIRLAISHASPPKLPQKEGGICSP